ncbi:anti-sigma factor domain-containing protein [Vallitalea pronyensis]|uniref:Anti-sigma factor domain-containing protein n=1 Tax=Vallitalea pronyensis TaxID=1348613 RepID=A0A8J8MGN3_9FIRM|nr:anti-sigma factor domain-containing protein [Vallitalea pronyensis]QUI21201.1 anti-sigma factor domain-containing protein [Vallitalea pronyensis]
MRAVVMEIKDKHVIVMTRDGQFKKIKKPQENLIIGMEITLPVGVQQNIRRIAAILVIVILMSGLGVSAYAYYTPYGYVNLDINPNIEIIYNRFNRVLKMNGLNEDGKNLVNNMTRYKYTKVEDTMSKIIHKTFEEEQVEDSHVLITYDHMDHHTMDILKEALEEDSQVDVHTIRMSTNDYEEVKNRGESLGKAILIENIMGNHTDYEPKELEQKPIEALIEIAEDIVEKEKDTMEEESILEPQPNKQKEDKSKEKMKEDSRRLDKKTDKNKVNKQAKDTIKVESEDILEEIETPNRRQKAFSEDDEDDKDKDKKEVLEQSNKKSKKDSRLKERADEEEKGKDKNKSKRVREKDEEDEEEDDDEDTKEDRKQNSKYNESKDNNRRKERVEEWEEDREDHEDDDHEDDDHIKTRYNKGNKRNPRNKQNQQERKKD